MPTTKSTARSIFNCFNGKSNDISMPNTLPFFMPIKLKIVSSVQAMPSVSSIKFTLPPEDHVHRRPEMPATIFGLIPCYRISGSTQLECHVARALAWRFSKVPHKISFDFRRGSDMNEMINCQVSGYSYESRRVSTVERTRSPQTRGMV